MPPVQKLNEKNVLVTCIPNPTTTTPVPVLFKVKNANEADQFIAKLNENLKEPISTQIWSLQPVQKHFAILIKLTMGCLSVIFF